MIIIFTIVVALATIILWVNPRNLSLRWLSTSLYTVGFSALCYYVDSGLSYAPDLLINSMNFVADAAIAYSFGMFGVVYSGLFNRTYRDRLAMAGLLLFVMIWMLTPLASSRHINYEGYNGLPTVLFEALFLIMGVVLLIVAYLRENQPFKKIERMLTNLIVVPTMLWIWICYFCYLLGYDLWQYNYIAAISFLFLFVIIGAKKGVLGVKIRIEMLKADASLHILQGSSSFINHMIKNEVGKIDILLHQLRHNLQAYPEPGPAAESEEMIAMAADSVSHIQSMMNKINERVQTIEVNLQKNNVWPMMEQCLDRLEKTVGTDVIVKRNFKAVSDVYFDPVHMKEVIHNMVSNAVEAMDRRGVLTASLFETKKEVILTIQDTGKGISVELLSTIFDPFYSTKKMSNHYGLGLYYCKNVMAKHNGSIHVESTQGKGTSFYIRLPK
ncbi:sensor histidine kinase [Cohnella faecalis]|uniref:histidine kinase n=1 Tax=Cohnella faecalis TaxID=2315694 RepID=A0A398CZQ9_9BACL|nr:sensor histidine kinase [Cohnella faecalis]RIE05347.1 GHKL domain-containing protein [Cohnella faecalis]